MRKVVFGDLAIFAISASSVFASLIPISTVPTTGNGLGAVNSVVTFQNTGVASGCVGFAGGVTTTGAGQCQGGVVGPTHEQTGSGNNTYTALELSLTPMGANTFANIVLIFNGNEGGGADGAITLEKLSLNLLSSTGTLLQGAGYDGSFILDTPFSGIAFPGMGNAGFGFQLDAAQAVQANALLAANPTLRIGASATVSGANSGPETIFISRIDSVQPLPSDDPSGVPEPTTVLLLGAGLIGVALLKKSSRA
jgi:hypothetical protein